jgi:hypothetical protein
MVVLRAREMTDERRELSHVNGDPPA